MKRASYDRDTGSPLSTKQEQDLSIFFGKQRRPISFVVFEDGQSSKVLLDYLLNMRLVDRPKREQVDSAGKIYNLAMYHSDTNILIDSLQTAANSTKIILLHAGASLIADDFVDLIKYLVEQNFDTGPEIVVLFDRIDLECNQQGVRHLFPDSNVLDLTFWDKEDNEQQLKEILIKCMSLPRYP